MLAYPLKKPSCFSVTVTFLAAQGLFVVSLFCSVIAAIACGAFLLVQRFQRDQRVAITVSALLFISGMTRENKTWYLNSDLQSSYVRFETTNYMADRAIKHVHTDSTMSFFSAACNLGIMLTFWYLWCFKKLLTKTNIGLIFSNIL